MHYEINVAKHGKHLFATDHMEEDRARRVFNIFTEKFPSAEGYTLALLRWDMVGTDIAHRA